MVAVLADFFGLRAITLPPYDLHVPVEVDNEVKNYLATSGSARNVIINIFTGSPERCFSEAQLCRIIAMIRQRYADVRIILLDHRRQLTLPLPPGVAAHPFSTLQHVMALIRRADLIISPDTAIVHIAAAWQKPLVSVYKNVVDNNDLWAPGYPQASQIIVQRRSIREVEAVPELIMEQIQLRGWL
ncbi:glycosyltransferase family 9 protein [Pantoea sp. 1.19]|uniref:glycosyltransferase family 9 protein n=1 Tax=Pantoea sp. 1.19 TaxID=1925589 RepID=UPI000948C112|nr:glycosyltransferase family 9 protein [Pantoea sp. 1.19]